MLIKEYRIPLPLALEEYKIAQLYMIQKKSREESEGEGSAVEILENKPYTDGPNGSGQYTYKVYHIGRHLPTWFRSMVPKTALEVHEEAWNAYPYTKTRFSVPFVDKFSMEVETIFRQDGGVQENIFKLNGSELRQREVDLIDMVNDTLSGSDYKKEEDPSQYVSQKTGRGPLAEDWIHNPPNGVIMCSYKLIKVEFRYWGLQSKVERLIHDYGLRRVMLRAHRQAWAWQDEWVGLTMDDIRRLERETRVILQQKLGRIPAIIEDVEEVTETEEENSDTAQVQPGVKGDAKSMEDGPARVEIVSRKTSIKTQSSLESGPFERRKSSHKIKRDHGSVRSTRSVQRRSSDMAASGGTESDMMSRSSTLHMSGYDSDNESMYSARPECGLDQIASLGEEESDLEFFDARESMEEEECSDDEYKELVGDWEVEMGGMDVGGGAIIGSLQDLYEDEFATTTTTGAPMWDGPPRPSPVDFLFLVIHGGSSLSSRTDVLGNKIDFQTLSDNIKSIVELHFRAAIGRIALRMVECPSICDSAFQLLRGVSPTSTSTLQNDICLLPPNKPTSKKFTTTTMQEACPVDEVPEYSSVPTGVVPLLATQSHTYPDVLASVTAATNRVYQEFLQSEEGQGFAGQICLLTDCMGSVVAYDILSAPRSRSPTPSPSPPSHPPQQQQQHQKLSPQTTLQPLLPSYVSPVKPRKHTYSSSAPQPENKVLSVNSQYDRSTSVPLSQYKQSSLSSLSSSVTSLTSTNSTTLILPPSPYPDDEREGFCFDVSHCFAFGSTLGLVLASRRAQSRKTVKTPPPRPSCTAFYNLFYGVDLLASRIEPLLDERFSKITPITVPSYRHYPRGIGKSSTLKETVAKHPYLFVNQSLPVPSERGGSLLKKKSVSTECLSTAHQPPLNKSLQDIKPFSVWWSPSRIDYILETPKGSDSLDLLPPVTFAHIVQSRYWEAKELISFILRQVLHHDSVCVRQTSDGKELIPFSPLDSVVKWSKKTTTMKIQRLSSNHRASDVVAVECGPLPTIAAKFQYGPLDMVSLARELVDVYLLMQGVQPKWEFFDTLMSDKHGRVCYTLAEEKRLPPGLYPVNFLVKGDHTTASCNLFVVPPHTEAVVFSVDGALASNFSISAKDIKIKPGAMEVACCWQELGYLIIYITGRPDMQKDNVLQFLGAHRFPLGIVSCADTLSTDAHMKTLYLARLIKEAKVIIHAAYGSHRHLTTYKELGLQPDQIFIHWKKPKSVSKKPPQDCQCLTEGFGSHLSDLKVSPPRRAMFDIKSLLGDVCFALPGNQKTAEGSKKRSSRSSRTKPSQIRTPLETTV